MGLANMAKNAVTNKVNAAVDDIKEDLSTKSGHKGSVMGKAFATVASPWVNAAAANMADDKLDELNDLKDFHDDVHHGAIYEAGAFVGDKVMDAANIATFGVARKVSNVFRDEDEKIDYAGLKQARKSGEIDYSSSKEDRARKLASSAVNAVSAAKEAGALEACEGEVVDVEGIESEDSVEMS